jgi:hypothetical protein
MLFARAKNFKPYAILLEQKIAHNEKQNCIYIVRASKVL